MRRQRRLTPVFSMRPRMKDSPHVPDRPLAQHKLRQKRVASEHRLRRFEEKISAIGKPAAVGSTWRSGTEIAIANAAPYPLELLLSGPERATDHSAALHMVQADTRSGSCRLVLGCPPPNCQREGGHVLSDPQVAQGSESDAWSGSVDIV